MSHYKTKRTLKQFWRTEGNPRLKGLLLAGLPNSSVSAEDVGRAWITDPNERERQLAHVEQNSEGRVLTAPVQQEYRPGAHDHFQNSREEAVARSLSRNEMKDDERERFLAGDAAMDKDSYIKRALLSDGVTNLDTLFREELETTLIQGAAPRKIARDAANPFNVTKKKGDLPRGSDQGYANDTAEGATIETGEKGYGTVPYNCEKKATGFEITDELISQSEPDIIEAEVRAAGARVENSVNRVWLNSLVDDANQEHDTGGSNHGIQMVNKAINEVDLQDFVADSLVTHPNFRTALFGDSNLAYANRAGSDDVARRREFSPLLGVEMFHASAGTHNTDEYNWDFSADSDIGAVAYQREHSALVLWDEFDMDTKSYEDPIRDLQGRNVRTYVDSVWRQPDAGARVEY